MAIISPTVLANNPYQFRTQLENVESFAKRIQIDLMDGDFAPSKSISINQIFRGDIIERVDVHLMYQRPGEFIDDLIGRQPNMIILHVEASGYGVKLLDRIKAAGIQAGIALMKETQVADHAQSVELADHALVFSGDLGHFGGTANLRLLEKVPQLKALNHNIEIGWDGGINDQNAKELADGGVEVLNVGGFIQRSENPQESFQLLNSLL